MEDNKKIVRKMKHKKPIIVSDGGPWATHDVPCPIYWESESAILDMEKGQFHPSWKAQKEGWRLVKFPRWMLRISKFFRDLLYI